MGHIKYNGTNNFEEEKCKNNCMNNNELTEQIRSAHTEPNGRIWSQYTVLNTSYETDK